MMKTIKRILPPLFLSLILLPGSIELLRAQGIGLPYTNDFNSGFPSNWTREEKDSVMWEHDDTLGVEGTGGLVVDLGANSIPDSAWLRTPEFDLQGTSNPEIRFSIALIQNNFLPPNLTLWYEEGGEWKRLYGWGWGSFDSTEVEQIETSSNFGVKLERENIHWVDVSYDLSSLSHRSNVRFQLRAELVNGGWALLDNFSIEEKVESGVKERLSTTFLLFPNPVQEELTIQFDREKVNVSRIELLDPLGRTLLAAERGDSSSDLMRVNLSHLTSGLYLCRLFDQDGRELGVKSVVVR